MSGSTPGDGALRAGEAGAPVRRERVRSTVTSAVTSVSEVCAVSVCVLAACTLTACALAAGPSALAAQASSPIPRTADGHPDLQGNWTNATMTPIVRPEGVGPVLTADQVRSLEEGRQDFITQDYEISDPDREAPPEGGEFTGNPIFDAATGGTGGYNQFFVDAGDEVAVFNGEYRSSLIVEPENGRPPPYSDEGRQRLRERAAFDDRFDPYDNPENRPLGERCLTSFGSNAGPPMTPNYFYNNNYTVVQTPDRRDCLTPGTEIIVDGYQAKDHSLTRANGKDITFTDGTKIFLGSSGTGAPYEREMLQARREQGRC